MFKSKVFLAPEATKVLPLITSIMRDVVEAHLILEALLTKYELANHTSTATSIQDEDINVAVDRLQTYVEEVERFGGVVRNTKTGTVDFTGNIDGQLVWFCWDVGEPEVLHFHQLKDPCESRESIVKNPIASSI